MSARIKFHTQKDSSLVCPHRELSVCEDCFNATPGLVDVYTTVYRFMPSGWTAREAFDLAAGRMEDCRLSPGTKV